MQHLIGEEKERTVGGAVLSLFLLVTKRLYGKEWEWSIGQIKTCRKNQHVKIDDMKEMSELFCGKAAVGGNYNSTRDNEAQKKLESAKEIVASSPFVPKESIGYLDELNVDLNVLKQEFSDLLKERDIICNEIDLISLDFEKLNERLRDLFELAGLGISIETFTHEFDTSIRNIKEKNQKIVNNKMVSINDMIRHINYVTYSLDALRKQMSYFNPGLKYVRAERQTFGMTEFLEQHKEFYRVSA